MPQSLKSDLRYRRMMIRYSQEELADEIGVHRVTIAKLEAATTPPSFAVAYSLAKFFGCPIEKLFYYADDNDPKQKVLNAFAASLPRHQPSRGRRASEYWTELL